MTDVKSEVSKLMQQHKRQIDELHDKLAAIPGINKERLTQTVVKLKTAHETFEEDAQDLVIH
jgi:hypothetical protein